MAAFIQTKFLTRLRVLEMDRGDSSEIADSNSIGQEFSVMADDEKKTQLVKTLTPNILRKLALSGKSVPSRKPAPPGREGEASMDGIDERTFSYGLRCKQSPSL